MVFFDINSIEERVCMCILMMREYIVCDNVAEIARHSALLHSGFLYFNVWLH